MDEQELVASFIQNNDLGAPPEFRLLDLVSEVGELAKDVTTSTDYGREPNQVSIESDEIGDVLFALLALAEAVDVEADKALDEALVKYDDRIGNSGTASSGT